MSRAPLVNITTNLSKHDGAVLLSAPEAILKGALEAELEITVLAGPRRGGFAGLFSLASNAAVGSLLRQHNTRLLAAPDAGRAVTLAGFAARSGRASIALVPNDQLDLTLNQVIYFMAQPLDRGGAMCVMLEDSPKLAPASCPRRAAARMGLPALEPANLDQLRLGVESALRLSRAGRCPIALIVHASLLRSADTLLARPNRVLGSVDAILARRRRPRSPRWAETGGWLRMARRLELNRFRAMPSPGERVVVGFITVGPADGALLHITNVLGLHGRVPVLQLGLVHPVDESAVARLLERCQHVIVLEPRPGAVEDSVLAAAEAMRRSGQYPPDGIAVVWGREIPAQSGAGIPETATVPADLDSALTSTSGGGPAVAATDLAMRSDDDLHPSILVRKITHLLHVIRPTIHVASQLLPDPPAVGVAIPAREALVGPNAALAVIRRMLTDVDQWLRERAPLEDRGIAPTALSIDGAEAAGVAGRIVQVETWDHHRFQTDGLAALVQAAQDDRPWILVVAESAAEEIRDLERLCRGAVPAERADRVSLESGNLGDRAVLRDTIREAAMVDKLTIIIVRDGPPPRYDATAMEQSLAEIDQLGFEPRQRLVRSSEEACAMHTQPGDPDEEHRVEHDPSPIKTEFTTDAVSAHVGSRLMLRVRPLLEEVEVIRTRPPLRSWHVGGEGARVSTPLALHARQPQWRAHLAGFRADPPGLAALALCEAGRAMGYHVRAVHDVTPIGAGLRAWSQVLFTRPRESESPAQISASIPYGEADLLLGLDARETVRAIGPDSLLRVAFDQRTHVVANLGPFSGEPGGAAVESAGVDRDELAAALAAVARPDTRLFDDFAAACRTWFHTDRVVDMALLGAAFQLGLIPVSPEAIEAGVRLVEGRGFGRARETFEFGRRLVVDRRLFSRPQDDREEDVDRMTRRIILSLSRGAWGGGRKARSLARLVHESLLIMPGLAETDPGREARRWFIMACHRCLTWGGLDYAQKYAELITAMYRADRGDTGRLLTRHAILPLAEAMLIRDPLFVASMASSAEQRRRTRHNLNVKLARGDRIERRYLTRIDLIGFNRRLRGDVRTSDWPIRATAMVRRLWPLRWRGTRRERELRDYLMDFVRRSAGGATEDYDRWNEAMQRLHNQAAENRLRGMALAELKMLVETPTLPPTADPMSPTSRERAIVG